MRVLFNRYALLGRKTGVGHYAAELLRGLHAQAPGMVEETPPGWLFHAEQVWRRVRPATILVTEEAAPATAPRAPAWKRALKGALHRGREAPDALRLRRRHAPPL